MSDEKIEIEKIQQELKQLSQRKLELEKAHQQRIKSYRQRVQAFEHKVKDYEQQKSLHQRLFGQPPLQRDPELLVHPELLPDPELQSVKDEIARLERDKDNIYKILQNAASFPPPLEEKDWSDSYFYSHTLKSLGFNYPGDQLDIYVTSLTGIGIVSKALLRNADDIDIYLHRSGFYDPQQIFRVIKSRHSYVVAAIGKFAALVGLYTAIVQLKNKNIQFN